MYNLQKSFRCIHSLGPWLVKLNASFAGAHQEEYTFDMLPTENVTTDNPFPTLGAAFGKVKVLQYKI